MSLDDKLEDYRYKKFVEKLKSVLPSGQVNDKDSELLGKIGPLGDTEIRKDEDGLYWLHDTEEDVSILVMHPGKAKDLINILQRDLQSRQKEERSDHRTKGKRRDKPIERVLVRQEDEREFHNPSTYFLVPSSMDLEGYKESTSEEREITVLGKAYVQPYSSLRENRVEQAFRKFKEQSVNTPELENLTEKEREIWNGLNDYE